MLDAWRGIDAIQGPERKRSRRPLARYRVNSSRIVLRGSVPARTLASCSRKPQASRLVYKEVYADPGPDDELDADRDVGVEERGG